MLRYYYIKLFIFMESSFVKVKSVVQHPVKQHCDERGERRGIKISNKKIKIFQYF